ncbi:DUF4388 domain-containing protein [Deinococcus peraridilitoris]|uniref:PatA-like N-terminal domain-containing protein n=1 Tax=Deinococcus peraridilitoris (strain DSM 19664 / LMG 22246 / CIP 109416 / KR-200) TaxID=937777 RepID=L0A3E3_DEIPD|nr:DUF4388 domain-containing protein [Deinococcus peraridilitoris]AFZ68366.1 hypothetical protein Deipe_2905 [Deinococcus peraridilitoris DSM 19664]
MQGDLADLPLLGVLELVHFSRKTGVLEVNSKVPFNFTFVQGEIVEGGILDWLGLDAINALPLSPEAGRFHFHSREIAGQPIKPFARLMGDWAHLVDEWSRVCGLIGSPSRVLRGNLSGYEEGRSVRAVARQGGEKLFTVAQRAADAVASGKLSLTDRYAWHVLRIRHPRSSGSELLVGSSLEHVLDGQHNLGELIAQGYSEQELREFLLHELREGLRFPGAGWVLRDLAWETENLTQTARAV